MKLMWKWWIWPFIILALATLLSVSVLVFGPRYIGVKSSQNIIACTLGTGQNADADYYQCLKDKYEELTKKGEPKAAFTELKSAYITDQTVKAQCHQLTHVIGRAAVQIYPNIQTAYTNGDNFCWSGYYHGVMESTVSKLGKDKVMAGASNICADLKEKSPYSFFHYNCAHGLGHGFLAMQEGELFEGLKTCDLLQDSWERESCYGGVFMENVMIEAGQGGHSNYLKDDDLAYPCNAVGVKYKEQCYLMQTSHALSKLGYDFNKGFDFCNRVESGYRNTCYTSLGRDASGSTVSDVSRTKELCLEGNPGDPQKFCIEGAVKDFISYYHSDTQAKQLCEALPAELMSYCRKVAADYYQSF